MNIERRSLLYIIVALTLALSLVGIVSAEDPSLSQIPSMPQAFYGALTIEGDPAPAGREVEARGEGVETGDFEGGANPLITEEEGQYGGSGGLDPKLVVHGEELEVDTPLSFYVDGVRAQCKRPGETEWQDTYPYKTGDDFQELDLNVPSLIGVELTKTVEGPAMVSSPVQFQVALANTGETAWDSAVLTDTWDSCLSLQEISVGDTTVPVDPEGNEERVDLVLLNNGEPIPPGTEVVATATFLAEEVSESCCNHVAIAVTDADGGQASAEAEACVEIIEGMRLYLPFVVNSATVP